MERMITLRSSDGKVFEMEEAVAMMSQTIKQMIEVDCADSAIRLRKVPSWILAMVVEYCTMHVDAVLWNSEEDLKSWDAMFVPVDQATLIDLIRVAHFLNIKGLVDLTARSVADMIKGKTTEEIRKTFDIKNDFKPENEEEEREDEEEVPQWKLTLERNMRKLVLGRAQVVGRVRAQVRVRPQVRVLAEDWAAEWRLVLPNESKSSSKRKRKRKRSG